MSVVLLLVVDALACAWNTVPMDGMPPVLILTFSNMLAGTIK